MKVILKQKETFYEAQIGNIKTNIPVINMKAKLIHL